jgi:enolase
MFNLIEGGRHTKNDLDIQEFMIVPCLPAGRRRKDKFSENLILCNKIFNNLKETIEKNFGKTELGDEGGFALNASKTEQALFLLKNTIGNENCKIAIDSAASEFYFDGKYKIDGRELIKEELLEFYQDLINKFPIISIEDPFAEDDWVGFEEIMKDIACPPKPVGEGGCDILIIGDDLTTTNIKRIKEAHSRNACNAVILKLNQIGTVSETIEACNLAKSFGWKTIVSHRSGETMDDFVADLAVGLSTDFVKFGSPAKEERMVKYKRLLEIEKELDKK